jgi:hypothetical protein
MAISITRHSLGARDYTGEQLADAIAVADAAVSGALPGGLYRIVATTASVIRIGGGLANANGGEVWPAGTIDHRQIPAGFVIACNAG